MNFFEKLTGAIARHQSLLYVGLDPSPERWGSCYGAIASPSGPRATESGLSGSDSTQPALSDLQAWLLALIAETADLVCAYKINTEFYRLLGAQGLDMLARVLSAIPADMPVILDTHHGDLNSSTIVAQTLFRDWQVDAVTLNPYAGQDLAAPFLVYPNNAIVVLCTTTNPSAQALQTYPSADQPFYLHLVNEVKTWGIPEQVALEVGPASADILRRIRMAAPERLIVARSVWKEGSNLAALLEAGLNQEGSGLLIPVPPDWLIPGEKAGDRPLRTAIQTLRDEINQTRQQVATQHPASAAWSPDVCLLKRHPYETLILQLYDIGCLQFGEFVQASGAVFPYYIDLRTIISNPQVFDQVIAAYADILQTLHFDRIAGIPYGALPTATGLALRLNSPMIFPRKEVKAHGTRRLVEGHFCKGETAVVVDDILISGNSALEGAAKLESVGLTVTDIVVFIDHGQGVKDRLQQRGYRGHAVLTLSEIIAALTEAGRLDQQQLQALAAHSLG